MRLRRWGGARLAPVGALVGIGLAALALSGCSKEEPTANKPDASVSGQPSAGKDNATQPTATGKKKIVFIFKIGGISYSEACKRGAEQAAGDPALNVDVDYQASVEGTAEKQVDLINNAIVEHADAIVISPVDAQAVVPALDKATEQGIKVFTWDADSPNSKRLYYFAAVDDVGIGDDIAKALVKDIGSGKVLLFSGQSTAENLNLHLKGIQEGLKQPGISVVDQVYYNDDDNTKATSMAMQALQAHPDVKGIACTNSVSPKAAAEALRKQHLVGKVKVWGLGLPSENKAYLKDSSISGLYLWDPQKLTYDTAVLVKGVLDGKNPTDGMEIGSDGKLSVKDKIVTLPLRLEITKNNVDQLNF